MTEYLGYQESRVGAVRCEACGWSGEDSGLSPMLAEKVLVEQACPSCQAKLVPEQPSPYLAALLRSPEQLPELEGAELKVLFEVEQDGGEPTIVLREGSQELWREPGYFECYRRYRELVRLLQQKYGARLRDVAPTEEAWKWLYGEALAHAQEAVETIREELKEGAAN